MYRINKEIISKLNQLDKASRMTNNSIGVWWDRLVKMYVELDYFGSEKIKKAYEDEVDLAYNSLMTEYKVIMTRDGDTTKTVLMHIDESDEEV